MTDDLAAKAAEQVDHVVDEALTRATRTKAGAGIGMLLIGAVAAGVLADKKRRGKGALAKQGQ